jgi:transcription-repair coupling factor (superfamily II helicase)
MTTDVLSALARANVSFDAAARRVGERTRSDLTGLPGASTSLLLSRAQRAAGVPFVVVVEGMEEARHVAHDLELFANAPSLKSEGRSEAEDADDEALDRARDVLVLPASDVSPFSEVPSDRRTAMERLAVLSALERHLREGDKAGRDKSGLRFLVVPAAALLRKVPEPASIRARSLVVRAETELDREDLVRALENGGYLRVPAVEDAGTFAVRGSIVDVFSPHTSSPVRIELDDWLVLSLKRFDPEDQRTLGPLSELTIHPVRETAIGSDRLPQAKEAVRDRCEAIDLPTRATRSLLDDLEAGRPVPGMDALLPAFVGELVALPRYLPENMRWVVLEPDKVAEAAEAELEMAHADHAARVARKGPTYPLEALYRDLPEVAQQLLSSAPAVFHRVAVQGAGEDPGPLAPLSHVPLDTALSLAGEPHDLLVGTLGAERAGRGKDDALRPLAEAAQSWLDAGVRVIFSSRTRTQAERLGSLLKGYDVPLSGKPEAFGDKLLAPNPGRPGVSLVVADVSAGFALATLGVVWMTEEEIFGTRAHRQKSKKRKKSEGARAFLEDLRALEKGDYVVHVDHGIGKYLGLEKKRLGVSKGEELRGIAAPEVEVLIVEYAGGDRLFLPVTRLHQIQKYAGDSAHVPKIDRLGGTTFSKTKAKVKKQVQEMADELLRLYAQRAAAKRPPLPSIDRTYAEFEATFPFEETNDQQQAIEDVLSDLAGERPMDRIVCGDVGFGKTEVAMRAAFRVAMAGKQVAVLCPTTVLAQQHWNSFSARMRGYPLKIEQLSRFTDKKREPEILAGLKDGTVDIVVGTHRLLSKDIHFKDLGVLVVDEEQRFGVTHKERVKKLRSEVDVLTLTATPIPRTLQLAVGGLRDLSLIATPPTDRRAVRTYVTRWDDHVMVEAIQRELARGGQAFFVYNRIEGLYERAAKLKQLVPEARFAVAHGQMGEAALEQTMTDFVGGKYDVLCATAIIESGLDIPRANTILIDRADTFGLAQLYQLRGRVGRSKERAYAYLVVPPTTAMTDEARARIEALERFSELGAGFQVASLDMELRGAGDVLGTEQSGNLAAVGFELFLRMLEEAVAELKGEPLVNTVDTEINLDVPLYLPEDYVNDVGLRLSFYKRFASAESGEEVDELSSELEDRFGAPPTAALVYVRAMRARPELRTLRVLGCEANPDRVTLHLREDTLLDPAKVMAKVAEKNSPYRLSPDMKLTRRFPKDQGAGEALDRLEATLKEVRTMLRDSN